MKRYPRLNFLAKNTNDDGLHPMYCSTIWRSKCWADVGSAAYAVFADRRRLKADGRDVSMLRAEIVDKSGNIVPQSDAKIRFTISGPGRMIGVGNGNPTCVEPEQATERSAFNGLCQAIVQTKPSMGTIKITAQADGLKAASVTLISLPLAQS